MKFISTQENLLHALDVVTAITGKNFSLPILNNILLTTTSSEIILSSTNLEIAFTTRLRGKIEGEGSITINGKIFREFASLQPSGKITCELKDKDLHVHSTSSKTILKGVSSEEFPVIPTLDGTKQEIPMSMDSFGRALGKVLPAITLNESRPEISGLFMFFKEKQLVLVGTDSYRLAEYVLPLEAGSISGGFIIPLRTVQELQRVFGGGKAQFSFTENQFSCGDENTLLVSRLIEGNYPDYQQIIPDGEKTTVSVNRQECIQAVKAASLFCKAGINDIELSIKKDEKLLVIAAANNQIGENITTISAVVTGEDVTVVFNYRYVLDALMTLETEDILFSFNGPESTGVLKQSDNLPLIHLIMPIRQ